MYKFKTKMNARDVDLRSNFMSKTLILKSEFLVSTEQFKYFKRFFSFGKQICSYLPIYFNELLLIK